MWRLSWVYPNPAASQEAQGGWPGGSERGWLRPLSPRGPAAASAATTPSGLLCRDRG